MARLKYSEQDLRILKTLVDAGYGWRAYSWSVQKQGWISQKQKDTLCDMHNKLSAQKRKATSPNYGRRGWKNPNKGDCDNFEWLDYGGPGETF